MTNVGICDTLFAYVGSEGSGMAKGQKPGDQMEAFSKDAVAQAHQAVDG